MARLQGCGEDRVAICGQPRTDVMFEPDPGYEIGIDCDRLVMWMPTFRKSAVLGYSDVEEQKTIVPLFSQQELADLNARLRKDRTGLLIKLHPSQDLTDALITDYSSVFTDYMLLDRPIAFTLDDYDDYKATRGFSVEDPDALMTGHKIRTREDFLEFMEDLAAGRDPWASERRRVNALLNQYQDGQNRRRCLEIGGVTPPADEKKQGTAGASGRSGRKKSAGVPVKTGRGKETGTTAAETGTKAVETGRKSKDQMAEEKVRKKTKRLMTPEEQKQAAYEILCWLKDLCDKEGIHYSLTIWADTGTTDVWSAGIPKFMMMSWETPWVSVFLSTSWLWTAFRTIPWSGAAISPVCAVSTGSNAARPRRRKNIYLKIRSSGPARA